jgi:putative ABC transport system permease protein
MKTIRTITISYRQLQINRSRSVFAVIALSVGIAAVITMTAIGNGARIQAVSQLEQMGTNLITINAGKVSDVIARREKTDRITTLRMKDCEIIASRCPSVREVVPSLSGMVKVKSGHTATLAMINGVTSPYFRIRNFQLAAGDLFTVTDDKLCQRVAVLGSQVSETLFGNRNPVGEIIMAGRVPFTVIGVLRSKGISDEGANLDAQVIIPVTTASRRIFNIDYINRIFISVASRPEMKQAEEEITSVLRETHRLDLRKKANDFTIDNQITAMEASDSSARSFTWLIAGVSAIALLVGGTGILAVMMLSVRARNPEIGLRMAVGAKRKDIVQQFMTESALLGVAGGVTGISVGLIIAGMVTITSSWNITVSAASIIVSLLFSLITGLAFGVIPARKAAEANVIGAIQRE